MVKFEML